MLYTLYHIECLANDTLRTGPMGRACRRRSMAQAEKGAEHLAGSRRVRMESPRPPHAVMRSKRRRHRVGELRVCWRVGGTTRPAARFDRGVSPS